MKSCSNCDGQGHVGVEDFTASVKGIHRDHICFKCNGSGVDEVCECGHHYGGHTVFNELKLRAICWGKDCECKQFKVANVYAANV
jgi:DnaJ-class molecular chaperone